MNTKQTRRGFTLIEMLIVIGLIIILAGLLMPALSAVMQSAKRTQAATEMSQIKAALREYKSIWQVYPPDYVLDAKKVAGVSPQYTSWDSGRALVFFLGTEFRAGERPVAPWGEQMEYVARKSHPALFEFPMDRLHEGHFLDPWGHPEDQPGNYYRYDNNAALVVDPADPAKTLMEGTLENPFDAYTPATYIDDPNEWASDNDPVAAAEAVATAFNWNATNMTYDGVDVWSRGKLDGRVAMDEFLVYNWDYLNVQGGTEAYFTARSELIERLEKTNCVYSEPGSRR